MGSKNVPTLRAILPQIIKLINSPEQYYMMLMIDYSSASTVSHLFLVCPLRIASAACFAFGRGINSTAHPFFGCSDMSDGDLIEKSKQLCGSICLV
jgi:hypothetical protein